jgi:hypothetical protein
MKTRILGLSSLVLGSFLAVPSVTVTNPSAPPSAAVSQDETALGKMMEEINRGFRKLRKDLDDAKKNDQSIVLVRELQTIAAKARLEKPARLSEVAEDARKQFVIDYQRTMIEFAHGLLDLEDALLAGENDRAKEVRDNLNKAKSDAHKAFKPEDK